MPPNHSQASAGLRPTRGRCKDSRSRSASRPRERGTRSGSCSRSAEAAWASLERHGMRPRESARGNTPGGALAGATATQRARVSGNTQACDGSGAARE
eukprot:7278364-Alexandrium_andersonii.AAC.1